MIEDITDAQYLNRIANWIDEMDKLGRFRHGCDKGKLVMGEITDRIRTISQKIERFQCITEYSQEEIVYHAAKLVDAIYESFGQIGNDSPERIEHIKELAQNLKIHMDRIVK